MRLGIGGRDFSFVSVVGEIADEALRLLGSSGEPETQIIVIVHQRGTYRSVSK